MTIRYRTLLSAALLCAAVLCSCSPPGEGAPPKAGTFASALAATRHGDLELLRDDLSKGRGLRADSRAAMAKLDPEAWLILQGARWREYDLAACYRAGDDAAMAAALGFSDDALTATLLRAPSHLGERISEGSRYFRNVEPPIKLLEELAPRPCPPSLAAYVMKYKAVLSERTCVGRVGFAGTRVTELFAAEDLGALDDLTAGAPTFTNPAAAARGPEFAPLLEVLPQNLTPAARALELAVIDHDGTSYWLSFIAKDGRWQMRFGYRNTLEQRLQRAREEALRNILDAARAWFLKHNSWPSQSELGLRPQDWVDPAAKTGERGWQAYAPAPTAGLKLGQATQAGGKASPVASTLDGRFAVDWDGRFLTLP